MEEPKLRRGVKATNWQAERQRWREEKEAVGSPLVRSRQQRKLSISERERLRKAGDLVEPQLNSFDNQPPVAHRSKSTVTFSERQRRRKRFSGLTENEAYDSLDQLFPGARTDYAPEPPRRRQPQSLVDSWTSGIRYFLEKSTAPAAEFLPPQQDESEEEFDDSPDPAVKKEKQFRFRLKLGGNGRRLLSGAIAGAFSRTAVAPLETIRTHLMVGSHGHSVSEVADWIVTNEGWQGLFRGNAINVLRVAPSKAIELFAFDKVKGFLNSMEGKPGPLASLPVSPVAGSCAGISSTLIMYPLELLKTRLTIQPGEYRGILHALWRIITEEGFFELYRGLAPSIIGVIPYAGVNYYAYDSLRSLYKRVSKEERIGNLQTLLIGSLAGAIASTSTFPLEVARKQMQVGAIKGRVVYSSTLDALQGIARERGIQGLYTGLGPSCLKLVPAAGLSFMCYEALKRILLEEDEVQV